jgi:hypothetical protein
MKLITIEAKAAKRLFWSVAAGIGGLAILTASQPDPVLVASAIVLVVLGLAPFYIWALGSSHGLPIWPAFSGYTAISGALPVLQASKTLEGYSSDAVFFAVMTVGGFLVLGTFVWQALTARESKPPKTVLMLERGTAMRSLFWCLGAGLLFQANALAGWFQFPGNSMQVARGIAGGLSYLGIFALAYFHGARLLSPFQVASYIIMTALMVACSLTGIMLANAVAPVTLGFIGYTLGAARVPWRAMLGGFVLLSILHSGKYEMRINYLGEGATKSNWLGLSGLPAFYGEWLSTGLDSVGGLVGVVNRPDTAETPSTVFDRAGTLHMVLLVQDKSPKQVPFLNGLTYEPIPYLLIPRFLAPNKGVSHAGNILLSMNYGLQDLESTRTTSIGWSLVAEAYANFGYLGVFFLALLLGALYGIMARVTAGVPITSFRFVAGLVVMAGVTNDNSLGVFITMQFQAIAGVALASVFLMRRQPNPFARAGNPHETEESPLAMLFTRMLPGGKKLQQKVHRSGPGSPWVGRRPPRWAPVSHHAAYAGHAESVEKTPVEAGAEGTGKPRQFAVPYRNYRRYRG